jgi:hypothetical protein
MSEPEIARTLGISPSTVSRDLQEVQVGWGERFRSSFDPVREVAEAVALFDVLEGIAVREAVRLDGQANASTGAKMRSLWAAKAMREARLDVLGAVGLIGPALPAANTVPRAAAILAAFRAARSQSGRAPVVSPAERAVLNAQHKAEDLRTHVESQSARP